MTTTYDDRATLPAPSPTSPGPRQGECLCCFLFRALDEHGCDETLRWSRIWRDQVAPSRTGLEQHLRSRGGFCDCEVLMNVHSPRREPAQDESLPPCQAAANTEPPLACCLFT